jgi:hypothetical protein
LTKDDDSQPVRISQTEERGFYIFFDPETWRRERVSLNPRPLAVLKFTSNTLLMVLHAEGISP